MVPPPEGVHPPEERAVHERAHEQVGARAHEAVEVVLQRGVEPPHVAPADGRRRAHELDDGEAGGGAITLASAD